MTDDRPTCDIEGCDQPGFARYKHRTEDRWIDVCAPHRPHFSSYNKYLYHTVRHGAYPAERPSHVRKGHNK